MSELRDAVDAMTEAGLALRPYIQHTCGYGQTDSPDGDFCTCGRSAAARQANIALARLRALADAEEPNALDLGAAARRAWIVK